jgi:23S rRNA (cytidine2498-2'-O)-methyltransferase
VPQDHHERAKRQLRGVETVHGELIIATGPAQRCDWAIDVWTALHRVDIESIGQAAKVLRSFTRNWYPYSPILHRRCALIREKLPHFEPKPLLFPAQPPKAPLGAFTLLDAQTMLFSPQKSSVFANGAPRFVEFKENQGPVSRAYLKLFEALTRANRYPLPGERCVDLGACPGGWTWVVATLGAEVHAIDRSPIDPRIAAMPGVTTSVGDAFAMTPEKIGNVDWLFSDVICYPERLLEHVQLWRAQRGARNYVCTLKFQGDGNHAIADAFLAIPGSQVVHLFHNKHELTWILLDDQPDA